MTNSQEKILNAFLDEVLNERLPDKSPVELLRAIEKQQNASGITGSLKPKTVGPGTQEKRVGKDRVGQKHTTVPVPKVELDSPTTTDTSSNWLSMFLIAGLLAGVVGLSVYLFRQADENSIANNNSIQPDQPVQPNAGTQQPTPDDSASVRTPQPSNGDGSKTDGGEGDARNSNNNERESENPSAVQPSDNLAQNQPGDETPEMYPDPSLNSEVPEDQDKLVLPPEFQRQVELAVAPMNFSQAAEQVDQYLQASWQANGLQPTAPLTLDVWVNRLSSRLLGRTLNATEQAEVNELLAQQKTNLLIRQELIQHFLAKPELADQFYQHWGRTLAWRMLSIGPSFGTQDHDLAQTADFVAQQLASRQPLDKIVYQMVSAVGTTEPTNPEYNPAASYLVGLNKRFGGMGEQGQAHVANALLGQRTQCAQCHNAYGSQLAENTQQSFYEFRAFFAQLRFESVSPAVEDRYFVVNRNFLPKGRQGQVDAPIEYQDGEGNVQIAYPKIGDQALSTNGFVAKVDRRTELAKLIVASPQFRQAMVDNVWGSMLNIPLSGIDGNSDPTLAKARQALGDQFAANDFDLKWLVSTIASSQAFMVGVGSDEQIAKANPFLGVPPTFDVFYSRIENRRTAQHSLAIVAQAYSSGDIKAATAAGLLARVSNQVQQETPKYILPFVPSKDSEWATSPQIAAQLEKIVSNEKLSDKDKIVHLVHAALGRPAVDSEIQQSLIILQHSDDKRTAFQDVWWSLLNSVDYSLPLNIR